HGPRWRQSVRICPTVTIQLFDIGGQDFRMSGKVWGVVVFCITRNTFGIDADARVLKWVFRPERTERVLIIGEHGVHCASLLRSSSRDRRCQTVSGAHRAPLWHGLLRQESTERVVVVHVSHAIDRM